MDWKCPICSEEKIHPVIITKCGHSFCKSCLCQLEQYQCPSCRKEFLIEQLQTNYALVNENSQLTDLDEPETMEIIEVIENIKQTRMRDLKQLTNNLIKKALKDIENGDYLKECSAKIVIPTRIDHFFNQQCHKMKIRLFKLEDNNNQIVYTMKINVPEFDP